MTMLKPLDPSEDGFRAAPISPAAPGSHREETPEIDRLLAAARRQMRVLIGSVLLALVLGVVYVATTVPQYTAGVTLLIDDRRVRAFKDGPDTAVSDTMGSYVDSQVELLRSSRIALAVIDKLQLFNDPEIGRPGPGLIGSLKAMVDAVARAVRLGGAETGPSKGGDGKSADSKGKAEDDPGTEARRLYALAIVMANLDVRRVQRTLALEIRFKSTDRKKAALIANAVAEAYLTDQLNSRYEATERASAWLIDRIAELKQKVLTSDLAIQRFKADHDLISSGGKLVSEQQLGEVNTQLVTAAAETAKAEARYARIKAIIDAGKTDAIVTEAIGNTMIDQLRLKFLAAAKRESDLAPKLGPSHGAVAAARMEMRQYERLMFEELSRIAESYLSDLTIAQSKEKALRSSLKELVGSNASANVTAVALRELEREAETFRTLYQTFLQRYQEAVHQQSFPITEARVVTSALAPTSPSHPRTTIILVLSLLVGGAFGVGIGGLRELGDRAFRTEEQVRDELGLESLGMLPVVDAMAAATADEAPQTTPAKDADEGAKRPLPPTSGLMRYALDNPLSNYAEVLRGIKLAADLTLAECMPRIIGAVSILPGEGKTTVAKNLASLLAHQGAKTLLIDADLRNPGLTRALAPDAEAGILQAVMDGVPVSELVYNERDSGMAVLPAVLERRLPHASEMLASAGMRSVLRQARQNYDWIVVDLPPLGPVIDARAMVSQIDALVLVLQWGRTTRRLVRATLEADRQIRDKCLGLVFNKVDLRQLKLYEAHGSKAYYSREYAGYYHEKS